MEQRLSAPKLAGTRTEEVVEPPTVRFLFKGSGVGDRGSGTSCYNRKPGI